MAVSYITKNILDSLVDYLERRYKKPIDYLNNAYFFQQCYANWAAEELITKLIKAYEVSESFDIFEQVSRFRKRMDDFSCKKTDLIMFSVGFDVASDALDFLLTL